MLRCMSDVCIRTCPAEKRREALELVLRSVTPAQRGAVVETLRPVAEHGVDVFAGLAIAELGPRIIAAAWLQPQVGRTATLWPTVGVGGVDHNVAGPVAKHALAAAESLSTVLAQVLLNSPDDPFAHHLAALEFVHLADLQYLMLAVPSLAIKPDSQITLAPPTPSETELFEQLIVESYEATLDCPGLEGLRNIKDVLAGYRTIGQHDPALWHILRWKQQPAGVLLLAPFPESNQWELVYMGVVPRMRGRQLGAEVLQQVAYRASLAGVGHVVLAVDTENHPAIRIYRAAGFVEWARRAAYIKRIAANSAV